jgi:hypothetical protein
MEDAIARAVATIALILATISFLWGLIDRIRR